GQRRSPTGWLRLHGVEHHNLHDVSIEFPLGVLCAVTGVSGSGKSSLVEQTLYPAVLAGLQQRGPEANDAPLEPARLPPNVSGRSRDAGRYNLLSGLEQIGSVMLIDQSPIGRSGRGSPVSFMGLFGEIRTLFAETAEAKV